MKNYLITLCFVLTSACLFSQTLIPDPNFEQALIDQNIDSDGILNGQVYTSDINSLLDLDISNSSINNLTGLEDFDNLRFLNCSNNNLTSLDLSSNFLYSLDCSYNMISVLNLSNQPELENIDCSYNQLTSLTLYPTSTGTNFTDTRLKCNNNLLTSLDLSGQYLLNYLDCSFNNIQNLSISTGDLLELYVNNNNLTELDFTNNDGIPAIDFVFDTKSNPNLCCIAVNDPVYCTANYSSFKDPTTIFGSDCAMTLIPDPNFEQALIDLNIDSDNTINGKVLTSDIDWISILDVSNKNISDLTGIEDFASLILLSCANNNLTSIDVSNNSLQGIYCDFNSLSVLDLSNQNGIEYIDCSNNQLTSLLLGNSGEDVRLRCNNNMLSTLNVTGYYLMDVLECSNNQIQSLDLSNNVDITRIIANNNNLSELLLYNNNFDNMSIGTVDFNTTSNPNLFCIEVENAAWSTTNWTNVDPQTNFSEDCTLNVIADNEPDENSNLALLEDATLSGSVSNGRGTPQAILYDPLINDYHILTDYNEYGVGFGVNLGRPDADNGFKWQVDWSTPKTINYVTFGGVYYNQPQPNAFWRISYLNNNQWITLDEGQGGWVDSGIYEWDGTVSYAITADALRVQIYSDGETDLVSIHLRGRGGISNRINDSDTETKATLIQYLPPVGSPIADFNAVTNVLNVDFDASNSSDNNNNNNTIVNYQWNFGDGNTTNSTSVVTTHTYSQSGTYLVTLKIIDNDGLTDIVSKTVTVSDGTAINETDENINLALLEDANLSGSVGSGRGTPEAILYDPSIDDYFVRTDYNEYGVGFGENLGRPEADNGFFWQVDWSVPKSINYITFGGTYNNQPQPYAMWRVSYLYNDEWTTLEQGQGGWIDSGIYQWDGTAVSAITADALRVQIYSDGNSDLKSIHLRGRGGLSYRINDTNTATKATLIQYLPASTNVTVLRNEKPVNIMKLSPNPATSNVILSFTVTTEVEVIEVSDLTGRLVSRSKGGKIDKEGIQISVKGLPIGVYNVKAISTTGEIYPAKLIKI